MGFSVTNRAMTQSKNYPGMTVCIGAGPAGLTASYLLAKKGFPVTVLEADPEYVGGISRTARYKNFHFDIGGHRFFSKSQAVEDLWTEILPNDMLIRPRSSRIFYRRQFYSYPLRGLEALRKLGIFESFLCLASYAKARLFPKVNPKNLEDWVSNQFGYRLFSIFFKTYTEKVWGMSSKEISADWAAQRIKGLSLTSAIWNAIRPQTKVHDRKKVIKTLIDSFRYPRKGPGMLWEAAAEKTKQMGGNIVMGAKVIGLRYLGDSAECPWEITYETISGVKKKQLAQNVISSAPLRELMEGLEPKPRTLENARKLGYRDFLTVALVVRDKNLFSDNWIYIHEPEVKVGRIQNFKSWSPEMVGDPDLNCYGLEYFCFEGDGLWNSSDSELLDLAKSELVTLGLCEAADILDGCVVRQKKAYPVYDDQYQVHVDAIRQELDLEYPGLHLVGRNGMHKYNNQDHAMMTAMLAVENIGNGQRLYDVWKVNQDAEYHEVQVDNEGLNAGATGLRSVPQAVSPAP